MGAQVGMQLTHGEVFCKKKTLECCSAGKKRRLHRPFPELLVRGAHRRASTLVTATVAAPCSVTNVDTTVLAWS